MKTSPGLFKNSFKKNKMNFRRWYMFDLNKVLTFSIFFFLIACILNTLQQFLQKKLL